jgi:sodium/potassium-transporting ATPase subunit alpha
MLVNVIGVIVAFVPGGMPIAVTLCLTLIAKRSYRQKILCKTLPVVETLGCVSIICSVSKKKKNFIFDLKSFNNQYFID